MDDTRSSEFRLIRCIDERMPQSLSCCCFVIVGQWPSVPPAQCSQGWSPHHHWMPLYSISTLLELHLFILFPFDKSPLNTIYPKCQDQKLQHKHVCFHHLWGLYADFYVQDMYNNLNHYHFLTDQNKHNTHSLSVYRFWSPHYGKYMVDTHTHTNTAQFQHWNNSELWWWELILLLA